MPNKLAGETSPYLLQHANNPVEWYPWGPESFENEQIAKLMNDNFVNIKVDREERPDVDAVYMEAVQAMTGHGGWPMTVFLAPDGRPFFGGTYFPREDRGGLPGFVQLLHAVDEAWRTKRDELLDQASRLTASLGRLAQLTPVDDVVDRDVLDAAVAALRSQFDPQWGGFGGAPKFPQEVA